MKFSTNRLLKQKKKLINYLKNRKGRDTNSRWQLRRADKCKWISATPKKPESNKNKRSSLNSGRSEMKS
jgi:hypothetical protein